MDTSKALELTTVRETLFVWMVIHGNLCLALRHPKNQGPSRHYIELFIEKLGVLLIGEGLLTEAEVKNAQRIEQEETKKALS